MKVPRRNRTSEDGQQDPAASMALLDEVMNPPLDPGYLSWAAHRQDRGLPRNTGRTWLLLITALVLGFLLSVAAQTLRTPDPEAAGAREQLRERITATSELGDERAAQVEALQSEITTIQDEAARPAAAPEASPGVVLASGAARMEGPGVVLTLNDPPVAADSKPGDRVLARDLQVIVNGLWAHGAEAIAINDLRLTATSTIRFAGQAIVVDLRGLARPYELRVIGAPEELLAELQSGATGDYLNEIRSSYRISVEFHTEDQVVVPAGSRLSTRLATLAEQSHNLEDSR